MGSQEHIKHFAKKVNLYLDNALNQEERQNVIDQSQDNPSLKKVLDSETNFRRLIKENVQRPEISDKLIQNIMNKIKR